MTHTELKEELRTQKIIYSHDFDNPRAVRQAISELRKEGIIFIPSSIGKGIYVDINGANDAEIRAYYHAQERHFKTQYHNSLLPVKKWLKRHNNAKLMGRLETL